MTQDASPRPSAQAPDFRLPSTEGEVRLGEWTGKGKVVLAFYAEDGTPACASQLEGFKAEYGLIRELGASVIGISRDDLASHRAFAGRAGGFPFPLASDADLAVGRAYGVGDPDSRRHRRAVFVIGEDGGVLHADTHFQPGSVPAMTAVFEALGLEF